MANDDMESEVPAGDVLPDDLQVASAYVGPYQFPEVKRRRIAATLYLVGALASLAGAASSGNTGLWGATIALGLVSAYHFVTAWTMRVDQTEALAAASRAVGFAVGHASAQLTWRGLLSRPLWRVVVYSSEDPPLRRGMVELDAVRGDVIWSDQSENPEDWSQLAEQ